MAYLPNPYATTLTLALPTPSSATHTFIGNITSTGHVTSENIDALTKRLCALERYCLTRELMPILPFSSDLVKLIVGYVVDDTDAIPDLVTPPDTPKTISIDRV